MVNTWFEVRGSKFEGFEVRDVNFLVATERHRAVADEVFNRMPEMSGNLLFDARIAILMREHGSRSSTPATPTSTDSRFSKLSTR
jgi:hypothetical protein